jgi:hypothetical protein
MSNRSIVSSAPTYASVSDQLFERSKRLHRPPEETTTIETNRPDACRRGKMKRSTKKLS